MLFRSVPIDAGTYTVGSDKGGIKILESSLARSVTLSKFFIDSTEVTNEQYSRWLQTRPNGVPTPNSWGDDNSLDAGTEKRPVQGVAYEHAEAYCNALGKRLPLEAEWEVAASGAPQPFKSPTDDDTTYDVGSQPGNVSAVGAFDMVGNSWEYVAASYEDAIREDPTLAVVRGGSNNFTLDPTKREAGSPTDFYMAKWAGFRCAVSADAPGSLLSASAHAAGVSAKVRVGGSSSSRPRCSAACRWWLFSQAPCAAFARRSSSRLRRRRAHWGR